MDRSTRTPNVLFVRTLGEGSMDSVARQLAAHLDVPVLDADLFRRSGDLFGVRAFSRAALRAAIRDRRFVRRLGAAGLPVHFPNHHHARYGLALREPYAVTVHDTIRWSDADGETAHLHAPTGGTGAARGGSQGDPAGGGRHRRLEVHAGQLEVHAGRLRQREGGRPHG